MLIFSTSNDKNTPTSNMLNPKNLAFSYSGISSLTPYCSKMLEFFNIFFLFLSLTLSCVMPFFSTAFLSLFFSFSMPLRFSLTLDLHFNNDGWRDDEDGVAVTIFPRASSKVLWTCSLSVASTANATLDMRRSECGWVDWGLLVTFHRGWVVLILWFWLFCGFCALILLGVIWFVILVFVVILWFFDLSFCGFVVCDFDGCGSWFCDLIGGLLGLCCDLILVGFWP